MTKTALQALGLAALLFILFCHPCALYFRLALWIAG